MQIITKPQKIILYPERYLFFLLLPWQLWALSLAMLPIVPRAITIGYKNYQLYYITKHGEIIPFGHLSKQYSSTQITLLSCRFGKGLIIWHPKHPGIAQQISLWLRY